jgi:cell division protein ZapE
MSTLKARYKNLIRSGDIKPDAAQSRAMAALVSFDKRLHATKWFGLWHKQDAHGLYLWGPPGRGKSMMMDLFFKHTSFKPRRRLHFHAFMAEVHAHIKLWRESDTPSRQNHFGRHFGDDPIAPTARLMARSARLLCFDEFQVTDIADAMILGRLFEALFKQGVRVVFTSNRAPDALYKDGLNRPLFLPFIAMIKDKLTVVEVNGAKDFRLDRLKGAKTYFYPSDDRQNISEFEHLWVDMTRLNEEREVIVPVNERLLRLPRAAGPLLRVSFDELCARPLGAADYLAIAEQFTTVFLEQVPLLTPDKRNEARRFVTLIDMLYEASTKLVVLAAAKPDKLYPMGDGAFEFERTASRLEEMRSEDYVSR